MRLLLALALSISFSTEAQQRFITVASTTSTEQSGLFRHLLPAFEKKTGSPVLINTSFNVRGEPIVCTPLDAYRCFMRTHIDSLVLGPFLLEKESQPAWEDTTDWKQEFQLD